MGKEMSTWREWETSAEWANSNLCPDCGQPLIITEQIALFEYSTAFNGICPHCRKQYNICADDGALTVNAEATRQQDRIDALEERIARLEAIVQKTLDSLDSLILNKPTAQHPQPQQEDPEEEAFRKQYGFLLG